MLLNEITTASNQDGRTQINKLRLYCPLINQRYNEMTADACAAYHWDISQYITKAAMLANRAKGQTGNVAAFVHMQEDLKFTPPNGAEWHKKLDKAAMQGKIRGELASHGIPPTNTSVYVWMEHPDALAFVKLFKQIEKQKSELAEIMSRKIEAGES